MSKHFLITGITGFAGAHLAQLLYNEGHKVYGIIRKSNGMESDILDTITPECFESIKFFYGDLNHYETIAEIFKTNQFDGVFHLAAQSHPPTSFLHPIDTFENNIMASAKLIDVIEKYQPSCKMMFCSTSEVYGNAGSDGSMLYENQNHTPSNPYGVSKSAIDLYVQERMKNGKLIGFITRAFSHTGPRRGKNFSISSDAYQIARIMRGKQDRVLEVGNLESVRVVIDVRDCVRAYYLLMMNDNSSGHVYNVCGSVPMKMGFFTDEMIKMSGLDIKKVVSEKYYRPIDIHCQIGSVEKLNLLTGWEPNIPIEKTLSDLLYYWLKKIS